MKIKSLYIYFDTLSLHLSFTTKGTTNNTISRNKVKISNPSIEGYDSRHMNLPVVYIE